MPALTRGSVAPGGHRWRAGPGETGRDPDGDGALALGGGEVQHQVIGWDRCGVGMRLPPGIHLDRLALGGELGQETTEGRLIPLAQLTEALPAEIAWVSHPRFRQRAGEPALGAALDGVVPGVARSDPER